MSTLTGDNPLHCRSFNQYFRYRVYLVLGILFFLIALFTRTNFFQKDLQFIVSDGLAYYVYLPSLLIDGDLDFSNQIMEHFPVQQVVLDPYKKTYLGYVSNKYPTGLAITLTPSFLIAHGTSLMFSYLYRSALWRPNGFTVIYQIVNVIFIMLLGAFSMMFCDRLLVNRFKIKPRATLTAIGVYWIGSHYAYYYFREPFMVHIVSTFWVTLIIFQIKVILQKLKERSLNSRLLLPLSFSFFIALVCRPTNIFLIPFIGLLALKIFQKGLLIRFLRLLPVLLLGLIPLLVQLFIWYSMTGSLLHYSYIGEGFNWFSPALWETLFSSLHGLFFWSPLLFVSVYGICFRFGSLPCREFLVSFLFSFGILWYLNSAWHQWWFGDSFGGRAFLELSSLFILGLAFTFDSMINATLRKRLITFTLVIIAVIFNYTLMSLYIFTKIPRGTYLF